MPVPMLLVMPAAQEQRGKVSGIYHPWQELLSATKNISLPLSSSSASPPSLLIVIIIIKKLNAICLAVS